MVNPICQLGRSLPRTAHHRAGYGPGPFRGDIFLISFILISITISSFSFLFYFSNISNVQI
jgi:hypothetical protein